MTSYVAGDVRAIQEYVFGSPRLLEMRGASALVDAFDRGVVPHLAKEAGGDVAFAGGGNFLARWEGAEARSQAERFEENVSNAFLELTASDSLTVVRVDTDAPFETAHAEISRRLAAAKHDSTTARQLASMPFLKRCESCGRESADLSRVPGAEAPPRPRRWVGPMCERKRRMLARLRRLAKAATAPGTSPHEPRLQVPLWGRRIEVLPLSRRLLEQATPRDFLELAGTDDLAVVVADGNGLGEWFEEVASWEEYRELSKQVHESLCKALEGALDALFPRGRELPVQVLIAGGDDLVAALPAHHGLHFARELVGRFRLARGSETRGMAAGVLLARPGFPFRQAHALAEELLGRAKERCRTGGLEAALDWHHVKGTHVQSLSEELAQLRPEGPSGSAWSYGGSGPFRPEELDDLVDLAQSLRTEVSPSQRGILREILSPRDDGAHTPLHAQWGVPRRVIEELGAWLGRLETERPPFELGETPSDRLLSRITEEAGDGPVDVARLRLADALLLADLGVEPGRR